MNGIDIRQFKAKQLTVELQPPDTAVQYDWDDGSLQPNVYKTEEKAGSLHLVMYFVGKDRTEVHRLISDFLSNLSAPAMLQLDGYKGDYYALKKSAKIVKTVDARKKKLELEFDGYFTDSTIEKVLSQETQEYITQGSRNAPCILRMSNRTSTEQSITIEGLTTMGGITATIPGKKTLTIDGNTGLVTLDGENGFPCIGEMWEFPRIKQKRVTVSRTNVKNIYVTMEYRPMWLT